MRAGLRPREAARWRDDDGRVFIKNHAQPAADSAGDEDWFKGASRHSDALLANRDSAHETILWK